MAKNRGTGYINEIFMTHMHIWNVGQTGFKNQFCIVGPAFNTGIAVFFCCIPKTKDYMMLQKNHYVQASTNLNTSVVFHSLSRQISRNYIACIYPFQLIDFFHNFNWSINISLKRKMSIKKQMCLITAGLVMMYGCFCFLCTRRERDDFSWNFLSLCFFADDTLVVVGF